jgi:hypothetical protein
VGEILISCTTDSGREAQRKRRGKKELISNYFHADGEEVRE